MTGVLSRAEVGQGAQAALAPHPLPAEILKSS
jgi:hypothetical protein